MRPPLGGFADLLEFWKAFASALFQFYWPMYCSPTSPPLGLMIDDLLIASTLNSPSLFTSAHLYETEVQFLTRCPVHFLTSRQTGANFCADSYTEDSPLHVFWILWVLSGCTPGSIQIFLNMGINFPSSSSLFCFWKHSFPHIAQVYFLLVWSWDTKFLVRPCLFAQKSTSCAARSCLGLVMISLPA